MILPIGNDFVVPRASYPLRKNMQRGFTLVEVLLAVSILAVGIIGVLRAYTTSVGALEVNQENIDAVNLLKEKMSEIEREALEQNGISPGVSAGEFKDGFAGYEWELEVKSGAVDNLNEVMLTVFRRESARKFNLATYVQNKE